MKIKTNTQRKMDKGGCAPLEDGKAQEPTLFVTKPKMGPCRTK